MFLKDPLLGIVTVDMAGFILGTGFLRFESPLGLCGLAKWTDTRIDILAVIASIEGRGQFRDFIAASKLRWKTICVWEDWNPIVGGALQRYGFARSYEPQTDGSISKGWRWDATSCTACGSTDFET